MEACGKIVLRGICLLVYRLEAPAHTSSSFLFLPGTFPLRTFHFVATTDNFLSFGRDKETLTRTGSLIYHLVQPVSEVRRERRRGQFLTLFPRSFRR